MLMNGKGRLHETEQRRCEAVRPDPIQEVRRLLADIGLEGFYSDGLGHVFWWIEVE